MTDNFKILEFNCSGLSDYTLDFELLTDSTNFSRISEFITNQSGFFIGDTTDNVELFNNHPYIKNNQLFWEQYTPTDISYGYRRIKADIETKIVKYHFLDER